VTRASGFLLSGLALLAVPTQTWAQADSITLCTVMADATTGGILRQDGDGCDRRLPPASTFKIALSLMGYDAGILADEHDPAWAWREGYPAWNPAWRAVTDPARWMKISVVWYSQQITARLGADRFGTYVEAFDYGNRDVSGGLERAWIGSSLAISPREQLAFLRQVATRQLQLSPRAYDMTAAITEQDGRPGGWRIHGKTGTGVPMGADGKPDGRRTYGWFVGWAIKDARSVVFARLIQDQEKQAVNAGIRARDGVIPDLFGR